MSDVRTIVLQGEILMLLHDIGKLHWRFVSAALGNKSTGSPAPNLRVLHTQAFLADHTPNSNECVQRLRSRDTLPPLQKILMADVKWLNVKGGSLSNLACLLALHHRLSGNADVRALCSRLCPGFENHPAVICAMYADTTDSLFSKGDGLYFEAAQASDHIHLARPLGGVEHEITQNRVDEDAEKLANTLQDWAKDVSTWADDTTLVTKRNALRTILKGYGVRNLSETRLPHNDVSLWQHSYAATAIFKALLASYLFRSCWTGLVKGDKLDADNPDLVHAEQRLALLAVRWDDAAYMARSVRSWEIVGRRAQLHQLAEEIKKLVEDFLCLGNEIYRDNQGICFLVPDLDDWAQNIRKQLDTKLDNLCNGGNFKGELRWKLQLESCGLRMTDMLHLWNTSFDEIRGITPTANASQWQNDWQGTTNQQICPRCGLRPIPWSASRTGGDGDKGCCKTCDELRQNGKKVVDALREGKATDFSNYGQEAFGVGHIPNVERFWQLTDWKEHDSGESNSENRLALVQGVMPLDSLYDASLFDGLLAPLPKECSTWQELVEKVCEAWKRVYAGDSEHLPPMLSKLLGRFGGENDGWCSDAEEGHYQRRWIDNLIFKGELEKATTEEEWREQARKIIIWALRRHPAPSRMARVWEQTRDFMRGVFALANELNTPFVPLTCDAGTFQILLPAGKALRFLRHVVSKYEEVFGWVRHLLPLHLSAGVFHHKAPLYIAMDAARRFRHLAEKYGAALWTLAEREDTDKTTTLCWQLPDGRQVSWDIPSVLPDGRPDPYHTWLVNENGTPTPLAELKAGLKYRVRPSTFDFEVLDASTRRYDIHAGTQGRRRHFMMPYAAGPRPYPLEELTRWDREFAPLFGNENAQSQLKNALELVARLHTDWKRDDAPEVFDNMLRAILCNCLPPMPEKQLKTLVEAACDGTFFDLFEWYDFINSTLEETHA